MASRAAVVLENVKFEHTVFALPFAYLGMILAAGGLPTWWQALWITVAMAAARTMAMSLNRAIDAEIDARNPRTAGRPIPSGRLSRQAVIGIAVLSFCVLAFSAWQLGPLPVILLPIAVLFLVGYHYTKRFTPLCHLVLGVTDGGAPLGGWVAVSGTIEPAALWLMASVSFWVGGFDLLYACQDVAFDRANGLHSVPADFGVPAGIWSARAAHLLTVLCLLPVGLLLGLGPVYWLGVALAAGLLLYEHRLVRPHDLSKLNMAFFNVNGYLSVGFFLFTFAAVMAR
ncbi:MAG: UbiA family prenyltransferase [Chloroflexi bacterium]|nr:UbiA family prenyltransferase [Chloroflexota bacterium]